MATRSEVLRPPQQPGALKWLRDNLFSNWLNALLTVISLALTYWLARAAFGWLLFEADWRPVVNFPVLYAVGQYPREELWRVGAGVSLVVLLIGASWGKWGGTWKQIAIGVAAGFAILGALPWQETQLSTEIRLYLAANVPVAAAGYGLGRIRSVKRGWVALAWALSPVVVLALLRGFESNPFLAKYLPVVVTTAWGGLLITFLLSVGGILLSFPIGVLLALGRRSTLPVVKAFSIVLIETIRGVPLITILFMFSVIVALFLPEETRIDRLIRALMAMTIFSAAYVAENVRGGLQAISEGQTEAAKALGMSGLQTTMFIVLPQALRAVIPAMVGQFISLFKDTTLVVIVGLNDLLGIGKSVLNSDPEFVPLQAEVYLFIALVYWIFSYLMSLASRRLETVLGVGKR